MYAKTNVNVIGLTSKTANNGKEYTTIQFKSDNWIETVSFEKSLCNDCAVGDDLSIVLRLGRNAKGAYWFVDAVQKNA